MSKVQEIPAVTSFRLRRGELIAGRYIVEKCLRRGGMGEVYLVQDRQENGQTKALKTLQHEFKSKRMRDRFLREYEILRQVAHPGVVAGFEYGRYEGISDYYVMEYIEWKTLEQVGGLLTQAQVLRVLYDLSLILAAIHMHKVLHLDLKLDNIFVNYNILHANNTDEEFVVKIGDFGMAMERRDPPIGDFRGSFTFVAPELFEAKRFEARSDLFSLGMIGYVLLNRRSPYNVETGVPLLMQKKRFLPRSHDWPENVPPSLIQLLTRCLQPDTSFRPYSAGEVAGELARLVPRPMSAERLLSCFPFVGRTAELRHFGSILHEVEGDQQWAVIVSGEAGVGKTRLIDEFAVRQQLRGFRCIRLEGNSLEPLKQSLNTEELSDIGMASNDSEEDSAAWQDTLFRLLELVKSEPLIICWHKFDALSEDSYRRFKEAFFRNSTLPILWVMEACQAPASLASLSYGDRVVRCRLDLLDEATVEQLVGSVLDRASGYEVLSRELSAKIYRKPAWIMLALRELARKGQIRYEEGYWHITDPELRGWRKELGGLWEFDRHGLSKTAVTTVEWLAVLDRPCLLDEMMEVMDFTRKSLGQIVEELGARGLTDVADGNIKFSQPIIQEQIYCSLQVSQRGQLHRWVGRWLEENLRKKRVASDLLSVARHFYLAGAKAEFQRMMLDALKFPDPSLGQSLDPKLFEVALEGSAGLWPDDVRIRGYEQLATIYFQQDRFTEAAAIFKWLLSDRLLGRLIDGSRTRARLGKCLLKSGDHESAVECLREAYEAQRVINPEMAGDTLGNLGFAYQRLGKLGKCLEAAKTYQILIEQSIPTDKRAKHRLICAKLFSLCNAYDDADVCYRQVIEQNSFLRPDKTVSQTILHLAFLEIRQGKFEDALKRLDSLERQLSPNLMGEVGWQVTYYRTLALSATGQAERAIQEFDKSKGSIQAIATPENQCRVLIDIIRLEYYLGNHLRGLRRLRKTMLLAQRINYKAVLPTLMVWALRLRWLAGKSSPRLEEQTLEFWRKLADPSGKVMAGLPLAEHLLLNGLNNDALEVLQGIESIFREAEMDLPPWLISQMIDVAELAVASHPIDHTRPSSSEAKVPIIEDPFLQGMSGYWLMVAAIQTGQLSLVDTYFKRTLSTFRRLSANTLIGVCLETYGKALVERGDVGRGISFLRQSNELCPSLGLAGIELQHLGAEPKEIEMNEETIGRGLPIQGLAQIIEMLNTLDDPSQLTRKLLQIAIDGVGAKRGLIFFKREKTPGLARRAAVKIGESEEKMISRGIADLVFKSREPIFSENASGDDFLGSMESVRLGNLRSIACLPIQSQGEIEGILYLDYGPIARQISEAEKTYLSTVSHLFGIVLTQSHLIGSLKENVLSLRESVNQLDGYGEIKGKSPAIREVFRQLRVIRSYEVPVILLGESGTGKELIARTVHRESIRSEKPFIPLNCAAFPEHLVESLLFGHIRGAFTGANSDHIGFFEQANGGTIFLDEVEETSLAMQGKLLRILQGGEYYRVGDSQSRKTNVRLIVAGKPTLPKRAEAGLFRQDLYYRMKVIQILIPPLRERMEDVPLLSDYFLSIHSKQLNKRIKGIDSGAMICLMKYAWPGNVRQLEHSIQQALIYAPEDGFILATHLPTDVTRTTLHALIQSDTWASRIAEIERALIQNTINECGGDKEEARRRLRMSETSFRRKLRQRGVTTTESTEKPILDAIPPIMAELK